jgi:hypothetical protein
MANKLQLFPLSAYVSDDGTVWVDLKNDWIEPDTPEYCLECGKNKIPRFHAPEYNRYLCADCAEIS